MILIKNIVLISTDNTAHLKKVDTHDKSSDMYTIISFKDDKGTERDPILIRNQRCERYRFLEDLGYAALLLYDILLVQRISNHRCLAGLFDSKGFRWLHMMPRFSRNFLPDLARIETWRP